MRAALFSLFFLAATAMAQSPATGDGTRGSTPPGTSQDGSRPADGAITGGATKGGTSAGGIMPGESGGAPTDAEKDKSGAGGTSARERALRCQELSGTLREECLRKEHERQSK